MDDTSQASFTMPDVFVTPPAEDKVPGWRCFNAANPLEVLEERSIEVEEQDVACFIDDMADDEASSQASKSQRRQDGQSVVDSLMSREYNIDHATADTDSDVGSEYGEETQEDEDQHRQSQNALTRFHRQESLGGDTGNDSDVIEVVKVSRSHRGSEGGRGQQPPPPQGLKRSTTFKAKASKALRTLSIAFRSSKLKPKPEEDHSRPTSRSSYREEEQQQPVAPESPAKAESIPPTPIDQTAPRTPAARMSRRLSQIFTVGTIGRSRSSTVVAAGSSSEGPPPSPSEPAVRRRSSVSSRPTIDSGVHTTLPSPTRPNFDTQPSSKQPPDSSRHDPRPPSTLGTRSKSTNRTFSRVNLKTLFSFSSNEQGQLNDQNSTEAPSKPSLDSGGRTTPTLKRPSSLPSTSSESSAGPQTPTTTDSSSGVQVGTVNERSNSISDEDIHFQGLGEGDLGIFPSDNSLPSKVSSPRTSTSSSESGYDEAKTATPPLYRRFSSSSYRSSMETTATATRSSRAPTLPPIHHLEFIEPVDLAVVDVATGTKEEEGDISLEMRLDSLHFDSLSFDADQFVLDLEDTKTIGQ
ncbi:hypothetical protein BKA70DRAFT_1248586 [Coprinopsis sp. MPI-PUGE-AT-0042]|nr:hypothetical protein BKA70DRAFT_1248586 [Coprinopsis sp. MPI-PUGE-AT-0042]